MARVGQIEASDDEFRANESSLGDLINRFRTHTLKLDPVCTPTLDTLNLHVNNSDTDQPPMGLPAIATTSSTAQLPLVSESYRQTIRLARASQRDRIFVSQDSIVIHATRRLGCIY